MRPRGVEDAAPYKHCCSNQNTSLKKQQKSLDIPPKIRENKTIPNAVKGRKQHSSRYREPPDGARRYGRRCILAPEQPR